MNINITDECISNLNASECRSCKVKNIITEMHFLFDDDDIADIFMECTSLKVDQSDGLPSYICTHCKELLINYQKFRLMCADSDVYFREKINVKIETSQSEDIKIEPNSRRTDNSFINTLDQYITTVNDSNVNEFIVQNDSKLQNYEITKVPEFSSETNDNILNESINTNTYNNLIDNIINLEIKHSISIKKSRNYRIKNQKLICDLCQKIFFKKHRLEGHLRQHRGLKPCVCKLCGKDFSKMSGLKMHLNMNHTPEKLEKFPCQYEGCSKIYTMKQSLNMHIRNFHSPITSLTLTKRNFICEQCGKSFKTNAQLKKHSYIHTGDMPFKCNLCPKKYATKHKLKEHIMRHEGIKNHVCSICGLGKTTAHELKIHMNYHTREKLHHCKFCSAVFVSTGNMSRHIKIVHCGVKSYHCTHCDKSFGKAETLKHHIMTHTGEKPHICDICNKRFIQLVALQTHKKIHNK